MGGGLRSGRGVARVLALGLALGGCGVKLADLPSERADGGVTDGPGASDAPLGAWSAPVKIPSAGTTADEDDGTLSSTGLELVFAVVNTTDANRKDLYVATRPSVTAAFGAATPLSISELGTSEETPRFSPDDKTLYFASDRVGGPGLLDIYKTTRSSVGNAWTTPTLVTGPNTTANEKWFMPCGASTSYLVVAGPDLAAGTLGGGAPAVVAELSSPQAETGTFLSADCLTIYFASSRSGTAQLYTAHRPTVSAAWQAPTMVMDFAALGGAQEDPWLSADGRTFAFVSNVSGSKDVYLSTR